MASSEELTARLEALRRTRAEGARSVQQGNDRVEYRTDAELAAAIADLERQVAAAGGQRIHTIRVSASKGLDA